MFGSPSAELAEALAPFNPTLYSRFQGEVAPAVGSGTVRPEHRSPRTGSILYESAVMTSLDNRRYLARCPPDISRTYRDHARWARYRARYMGRYRVIA